MTRIPRIHLSNQLFSKPIANVPTKFKGVASGKSLSSSFNLDIFVLEVLISPLRKYYIPLLDIVMPIFNTSELAAITDCIHEDEEQFFASVQNLPTEFVLSYSPSKISGFFFQYGRAQGQSGS